jgi:arginine N-succinyltransferase
MTPITANAGPKDWLIRAAVPADVGGLLPLLPSAGRGGSVVPSGAGEWLYAAIGTGETDGGVVDGCVRVRRGIGLEQPRYWYHVGRAVQAAPELGLHHSQRTLLLGNDLTGAWEIADLACDRAALDEGAQSILLQRLLAAAFDCIARERGDAEGLRGEAAGRASLACGLAEHERVICEVPGMRDAEGASPFWRSLGRHFYDGDVLLAAERHGPSWRTHVAALLPREPLLVSFLASDAQAAIGVPGVRSRQVVRALHAAGLRAGRYVTIDDAGPVFEAELPQRGE